MKIPRGAGLTGGASISWASRCSSDPRSGAVRGRAAVVCAATEELIVSDARISFRIDQVRHEVHEQKHQGHEEDAPLNGGENPPFGPAHHGQARPPPTREPHRGK